MIDRHHIMFEKSTYMSNPQARSLRTTHSLIPRIDREVHEEIHRHVTTVPLIGRNALIRVVQSFDPTGNTLQDIDLLARSIDKATKPNFSLQSERDLGGLAIEALMAQRNILATPYVLTH